jgi:uncharacterized protein
MKKLIIVFLFMITFLTACGYKYELKTAEVKNTMKNGETINGQEVFDEYQQDIQVEESEMEDTMGKYQIKEILWERDGMSIYGQAFIPANEKGKYPTVIIGHGFTGTYRDNTNYAEFLAENGYAAYVFDFCGGSNYTKSDGNTRDMSVITEVEDMKAVLEHFKTLDFVDSEHIFLMGESQGGFVAALTAAERPKEISGLIMLYPAFIIPDNAKASYGSVSAIPDDTNLWGVHVSAKYYSDLWDLNVYDKIGKYTGDVLIFHGTQDHLVDISYSKRAAETYESAELVVYDGAGHGFNGSYSQDARDKMVEFVTKNSR